MPNYNPSMRILLIPLFILLLLTQIAVPARAQSGFELKDGDRVVLLGAGLVENEQRYGWLEYMLSSAWPERYITFRNLGWSGDTVFGEARTYYTTPPSPFELLLQQVREVNPTVIILAYGQVESEMGIQGLEGFNTGMNILLDSLQKLSSKIILLNPIRTENLLLSENQPEVPTTYQNSIQEISEKRALSFLDIGTFLSSLDKDYWETRVLLNEKGYSKLATYIRNELNVPVAAPHIQADCKKKQVHTSHAVSNVLWEDQNFNLSLSLTLGSTFTPTSKLDSPKLTVSGLKKGNYGLRIDGEIVAIGTHKEWEEGKVLQQGPWIRQAEVLRQSIQKKDEIYFRKYRPQNRTYIVGFRAYEQGRHEEDLKDLGLLVAWLDGQIHHQKQPKTHHVELFSIQ